MASRAAMRSRALPTMDANQVNGRITLTHATHNVAVNIRVTYQA